MERFSPSELEQRVQALLSGGAAARGAVLAHDLDRMMARFYRLQAALPMGLHATAIKAHPLVQTLRRLVQAGGGLEAASTGELAVAQVVEGIRRVEALRQRLETRCGRAVPRLDVGGGVPVAYVGERPAWSLEDWAEGVRAVVEAPVLVTELGRWLQAPCGFALSRVEFVRNVGDRRIATLHIGADLLLRTAYAPLAWPHEFLAFDAEGRRKEGEEEAVDLVGPLCFAGDILGERVLLPHLEEGDWVVVRDTGAYTLSMWSRHCSRPLPPTWGFEKEKLVLLHGGEDPEAVAHFWGAELWSSSGA